MLVGIPIRIASSAVGLKICALTAVITKYKSTVKNERKKHDKTVLLAKNKLNHIEVLISKVLIDLHFSHDESFSVNNELREHNAMKEEIKNPVNVVSYNI